MAGVVHISEEEAARDFASVMQHIRSGDEVRLDCKDGVTAVIKKATADEPVKARSIAAIIQGLEQREEARGLTTIDEDFPVDVAETRTRYSAPLAQPTFQRRTIAEAIEILRLREETQGLAVPDPDMAADMEEIHALYNEPMDVSKWD